MPNKKANSKLPHELNENWGSNYMMDGFWHDMEYEHGLRENPGSTPIPQPATSGMAQLPDGMIMAVEDDLEVACQEEEGAMDLEGLGIVAAVDPDVDRTDMGIVDHSWIGDAFQDPTRLPKAPVYNVIPELQEAWGDRTDGIRRIDLRERDAFRYEDALQEQEDDDPLHREKLARLLQSAMRKSAAQVSLEAIKRHLASQVNVREAKAVQGLVKALEAEHGLVGNVYVRASAFPGLHQGRWGDAFRRVIKGCRYLVASKGDDCSACAAATGLVVVNSPNDIDWEDAYDHYAPGLTASGRLERRATVIDKREALRVAFLREGKAPSLHIETAKVRHTMPVDMVSASEARRVIAEFTPPQRVVLDMARRWKKADTEKVLKKLGQMVSGRLLTVEEADQLVASKAPPTDILRAAAKLALVTKTAKYAGEGPRISGELVTREAAWESLRNAESKAVQAEAEAERRSFLARVDQKTKLVVRAIQGGLRGKKLGAFILQHLTREEAAAASPVLSPILKKTSALNPKAPKQRKYSDAKFTRHVASTPQIEVSPSEMKRAAKWVRQQMNEGFAGEELDRLVQIRLNRAVAGSRSVREARETHEGLAGHLYVDAAAYATKEGTTGCDEGALRHRTNPLKYVLAMSRCGGCVFKNADGVCQKYNKKIIDEIPVEKLAAYRRQAIASHQMTDAEEAASMFSNNDVRAALNPNPVDEFGLHNAALDEVETEAPQHSALDGIFFGGFEV